MQERMDVFIESQARVTNLPAQMVRYARAPHHSFPPLHLAGPPAGNDSLRPSLLTNPTTNAKPKLLSAKRDNALALWRLIRISQCAVERRGHTVGVSPTWQLSLQPVAIGAVEEVTNLLKPSV